MAYITELLGFIGLDVDDESFQKAEGEISDVIGVFGGLITIAASAATAVTGAAFAMVNSYAETATEVDRLTKRLNVNAEAFQATAYAAKSFGIEQDQLADGMKELSMRAGEFALTGEGSFKDAAGQLGLTREQVKGYGNDVNGLFNLVRDKLAAVQNQGQRQFLADALFGGGLADVGGEFFSQTSAGIAALQKQAQESGIVISQEQIDMAREYTREMDYLQARIKGLWNIVAGNLLPIFTRITKEIKEFLGLHGDDIVNGLTVAIKGLIEALKYLGIAAAIAMPYLIGAAAISGWAKLISLVTTVTTSFTALRFAALLAWAAAAVGPVLVGAAILALILIVQDLYTYFTGGDSVTGLIVDEFGKAVDGIKDAFIEFRNWIGQWFSEFIASTTKWMDDFDKKVAQMGQPIVDKIKSAWNGLKAWFIDWARTISNALSDFVPEWLKNPASLIPEWARPQAEDNQDVDSDGRVIPPLLNAPTQPVINQVLQPPKNTVISPPTMAQGMAQANAGMDRSVNNSGNTTIGDINVTTTQNGTEFANQFRQEMMRNNASTVKNLNGGVTY